MPDVPERGASFAQAVRPSSRWVRHYSFAVRYLTLFGGEAFSKLCVMAAFAYLARVLGPKDFGLIELSLSIIMFFILGVESGLGSYGARLIAVSPDETPTLVPQVILLRAIFVIPAYLAIVYLSIRYGMPGIGVLAVYGFVVVLVPLFNQWVFQGLGQMHWVATGNFLRYVTFAVVVLAVIRPGADPRLVAAAEVVGALALIIFNAIMLHGVLRLRLQWRGALRGALGLFRETWSLGASNMTWACLWYAPTVLLGRLSGPEEVAWLAASVRIVMALHTFVWLYFFNMLPNLTREIAEGVDAWRRITKRSLKTSMWPACLIAVGGVLIAPVLVTTVYGGAYGASALPLQIVIWMIPVAWFSGNFRFTLIASGHQRSEFVVSSITAAVTIGVALVLIPMAASVGAAAALLAGGVINSWLAVFAVRRCVGSVRVLPAISRPVTAGAACLALGFVVSLVAGHLAGAFVGCAAFVAIGMRQDNELVDLLRLSRVWS